MPEPACARPVSAVYSCNGKEAFENFVVANMVLRNIRRNRQSKRPINAYRCIHCQAVHIGSKPPTKHSAKRPRFHEGDAGLDAR